MWYYLRISYYQQPLYTIHIKIRMEFEFELIFEMCIKVDGNNKIERQTKNRHNM